jgi:hypothetical protein
MISFACLLCERRTGAFNGFSETFCDAASLPGDEWSCRRRFLFEIIATLATCSSGVLP